MNTLVISIAVLSVLGLTSALNVTHCEGGRKIDDLTSLIQIGNCKKPPCRLRKKNVINVQMKLKPEHDVQTLQNSVFAKIVGIPFPFIGVDETDACATIYKADGTTKAGCPLKGGEEYIYKRQIEVLEIYPRIKIVVHWALKTPKGELICFEVPARITN